VSVDYKLVQAEVACLDREFRAEIKRTEEAIEAHTLIVGELRDHANTLRRMRHSFEVIVETMRGEVSPLVIAASHNGHGIEQRVLAGTE
jgi:hypothetical protein